MAKLLLSLHVLAAILTVGPITVAASLFPRYARQAAAPDGGGAPSARSLAVAGVLHRICRGYAAVGIAVPVFGLATGAQLGILTDAWLVASMVLTALAAALLVLVILPRQEDLLPEGDGPAEPRARALAARLAMTTGVFNLLWAVVVVLMIVRPGSTTSA
ncbi:hypothetical protein [Streptomyces sedi]|uniref:DUF2269 family protein n=1 Tax=Streptomyces sedi TaxID=555059 RepID=A0A5C4URB1_9ACTN|nr:hypothetical protein [Streptomyces sedi]TNM26150.1 hypothetical protein FH715_24425 [Streptomyces sedi]